ncbi:ATP-binding protein [Aestuariivita sp.]|jgi:two-component system phosphate regulon sensor histidine kinase PhoR|uniref:sensor histidine kinase n=1 Tax=Aestuariivita sp. TaxID=1872407 RepID=UPI00217362BD|nr:ATP-binding protein [Aestuariivita sp.]MCE8005685.1 two-component sensor histidine kinase [Aestuariivita sp.]
MSDLIDAALSAVPLPALLVDQTQRIVAANADAQTLLGPQIETRHFATILRQPPILETIEQCLGDRLPRNSQYLANDGAQDITFDVACRFVPGVGAREAGGVLISFLDVTHVEQAGQMRRDFVANVSHELRTPLTALMGFIETLRGPARDDPEARARFLNIMEGEASRMNRLVGDLLSLSRVEGDERVRPKGKVDLMAHLRSTLHSLRPLADEAGVAMILPEEDRPVMIPGDGDQLQQVFTNLVENAIKYGNRGGEVRLTLSEFDRDGALRGPSVRVQVTDDGPGIDPVHLPRLTERFYRADSHRSRELGGTGLGLAIVKHIVNRHRGRLRVSSELGEGSTFTVILPK